jgi:hypothetical protein
MALIWALMNETLDNNGLDCDALGSPPEDTHVYTTPTT